MAKERNLPAEPGAGRHGKGEAVAPEPPDREVVVGERGTWGGPGGPGGSPAELDRARGQKGDPEDAFEQGLATIDARRARGNPGTVTTGLGSETTAQDAATSKPGPAGAPSETGKIVEDEAAPGTWGGDSAGGGYPGGTAGVGGAPRIKGDVPGQGTPTSR